MNPVDPNNNFKSGCQTGSTSKSETPISVTPLTHRRRGTDGSESKWTEETPVTPNSKAGCQIGSKSETLTNVTPLMHRRRGTDGCESKVTEKTPLTPYSKAGCKIGSTSKSETPTNVTPLMHRRRGTDGESKCAENLVTPSKDSTDGGLLLLDSSTVESAEVNPATPEVFTTPGEQTALSPASYVTPDEKRNPQPTPEVSLWKKLPVPKTDVTPDEKTETQLAPEGNVSVWRKLAAAQKRGESYLEVKSRLIRAMKNGGEDERDVMLAACKPGMPEYLSSLLRSNSGMEEFAERMESQKALLQVDPPPSKKPRSSVSQPQKRGAKRQILMGSESAAVPPSGSTFCGVSLAGVAGEPHAAISAYVPGESGRPCNKRQTARKSMK